MKIYKTLKEAKETQLTKLAGIYYIRNKITNLYYIGQAMCIRKRFNTHYNLITNHKLINKLYEDVIKLGLENFEYVIIGIIKNQNNLTKNLIKEKLDKYEKYFIKKYNSYYSGYNQTLGGDGGILGYKMTDKLKEIIGNNSKKLANDGRNTIYVYDLMDKKEYTFTSYTEACKILNISRDSLYSAERRNGICKQRYIPRKNKEEIYKFLNSNYNKNKGLFKRKITKDYFIKILETYPNKSIEELCNIMGICKKTFYNYKNEI